MNVDKAEAQLVLAKAEVKYLVAKAAYREDIDKKPAFIETRNALCAARDTWRNNYREVPNGPGDAVASPAPAVIGLEVT